MVAEQIAQLGQAHAGLFRQRTGIGEGFPALAGYPLRPAPGKGRHSRPRPCNKGPDGNRLQARKPAALASASVVNSRTFCGFGGRAAQEGRQ
jgi:hypothetical protein